MLWLGMLVYSKVKNMRFENDSQKNFHYHTYGLSKLQWTKIPKRYLHSNLTRTVLDVELEIFRFVGQVI